jgi:hypothetical protein
LFDDGDRVDGYYVSFSEPPTIYEEEEGVPVDAFGVPDHRIFYYAPEGEAELIELSKANPRNDFQVLSYELEYDDRDIEHALLMHESEINK